MRINRVLISTAGDQPYYRPFLICALLPLVAATLINCADGTSPPPSTNLIPRQASADSGVIPQEGSTQTPTTDNQVWEKVTSPGEVIELIGLGNNLICRTRDGLQKSSDYGDSWTPIRIRLRTGSINAIDEDRGILYLATDNGVAASRNQGRTWAWSLYWGWDRCMAVDFKKGVGWTAIDMWGSMSGPCRKTPGGGWSHRLGDMPWESASCYQIVADPVSPKNVAYVLGERQSFRTLNGGRHWQPIDYTVVYAVAIGESSVIFSNSFSSYSFDRGMTWNSMSPSVSALVHDPETDTFYAALSGGGVSVGVPGGEWHPFGLENRHVVSMALCGEYLVAATSDGEIHRTKRRTI